MSTGVPKVCTGRVPYAHMYYEFFGGLAVLAILKPDFTFTCCQQKSLPCAHMDYRLGFWGTAGVRSLMIRSVMIGSASALVPFLLGTSCMYCMFAPGTFYMYNASLCCAHPICTLDVCTGHVLYMFKIGFWGTAGVTTAARPSLLRLD